MTCRAAINRDPTGWTRRDGLIAVCSWCVRDGIVPEPPSDLRTDGICSRHEDEMRAKHGLKPRPEVTR